MARLIAATYNEHKVEEYKILLAGHDVEIVSLDEFCGYEEPEENGTSFAENASIKALAANKFCEEVAFADDSGLEVEHLDNAPGIYSARYAENDAERIKKVLTKLEGAENRKARFVCVLALAVNGEIIETFEGVVNGTIADVPRGDNGFGYDPIFIPDGYDKTFGELPQELKNKISHRANAAAKAIKFVEDEMSILDDEFDSF